MFLKSQGRPGPKGTAYPRFRAAGPPGAVRVHFDLFLSGPAGGEAFFWGRQRAAKKERPERAKSAAGPRNKTKGNLCFLHSFCVGISLEGRAAPAPKRAQKNAPAGHEVSFTGVHKVLVARRARQNTCRGGHKKRPRGTRSVLHRGTQGPWRKRGQAEHIPRRMQKTPPRGHEVSAMGRAKHLPQRQANVCRGGVTKSPPFPKRGRAGACALCGGDALSTYPSSRRPGRCTHAAPQARARGGCRPDGPGSRT